jgi:hypothetical protein
MLPFDEKHYISTCIHSLTQLSSSFLPIITTTMGKGSLPPIIEAGLKELSRRGRSDSALNKTAESSAASTTSSARKSIMPLSRLVSFRRISSAVNKGPPQHDKKPLLRLNLSSQSFLDSIVIDDRSKKPLYTIKTEGPTTRITRNVAASSQFCTVKWPKVLPTVIKGKMVSDGVSIHLGDARWIGGENLLQKGARPEYVSPLFSPIFLSPLPI